jgi:hypothetical protein
VQQQKLEAATARPPAVHSRAHDARIVHHQQIRRPQQLRQLRHATVLEPLLRPVDHQQARVAPLRRRLLRDELFRQRVRERRQPSRSTSLSPGTGGQLRQPALMSLHADFSPSCAAIRRMKVGITLMPW